MIPGHLPGQVPIFFQEVSDCVKKALGSMGVHQPWRCRFPYFWRVTLAAADIGGADKNDLFAPKGALRNGPLPSSACQSRTRGMRPFSLRRP
jgi:hypothetical protein